MTVIGIHGAAGSGKDTAAEIIKKLILENNPEAKVKKVGLADKIKDIISIMSNIPREKFDDREFKESLAPMELFKIFYRFSNDNDLFNSKLTVRNCLEILGTDIFRKIFGKDIWIKLIENDIEENSFLIISDIRFYNEIVYFQKSDYNSFFIKINTELNDPDKITGHESRLILEDFCFDAVIKNDYNLDNFTEKLKEILIKNSLIKNDSIFNYNITEEDVIKFLEKRENRLKLQKRNVHVIIDKNNEDMF